MLFFYDYSNINWRLVPKENYKLQIKNTPYKFQELEPCFISMDSLKTSVKVYLVSEDDLNQFSKY